MTLAYVPWSCISGTRGILFLFPSLFFLCHGATTEIGLVTGCHVATTEIGLVTGCHMATI